MVKGAASAIKVHYKGQDEDFIIFIDDLETFKKWQDDKSVPMVQFISTFKVFVTHKHGNQGQLDDASKATLAAEFNTENEDEVIKKILEKGDLQEAQFPERQGPKNDNQMGSIVNGQPGTR